MENASVVGLARMLPGQPAMAESRTGVLHRSPAASVVGHPGCGPGGAPQEGQMLSRFLAVMVIGSAVVLAAAGLVLKAPFAWLASLLAPHAPAPP